MELKKRLSGLLALLLCLCLALSLIPAAAASEPEESAAVLPAEAAALPEAGDTLPTAPYCTWKNAKSAESGDTVSYTLNTYNSKLSDAQVWLAVNLKDDQILQLSFVNVPKGTYAYIYRASVLESDGPKSSNYAARFSFSAAYTGKWQADYAGVWYVLLMPSSSGNVSDTAAAVTLTASDGDLNEPNNTRDAATELTENVSTYFTLTGYNDADWFKITTANAGDAIKIYLSNFDYTVPTVEANLYAEGSTVSLWDTTFSGNGSGAYKADEPGAFYLKLNNQNGKNGSDRPLRIRFELIPGDEQELNDKWQDAWAVPYDSPVEFTLNGDNDYDWFCFETALDGEIVTMSLTGFETDYSNKLYYAVYKAKYDGLTGEIAGVGDMLYGESSVSITHEKQMSFNSPGRYYLRIRLNGRTPVENPLTLILKNYASPDSQEPNNTRDHATLLFEEAPTTFNLPQGDTDWFRFTADEPNMTMELKITIPSGGSVNTYLWSGADFEAEGSSASSLEDWYCGSGAKTLRYMLNQDGDYYLRITPYSNNGAFDTDATVTYRLIPPDEHERNNGWKSAATMNPEAATSFTLPAANDTDWFRFVTTEPDQTVELTITVPTGGSTNMHLWSGADFAAEGNNANNLEDWYCGSGVKTVRYMLKEVGDYYVRVTPYSSDRIFYEEGTISYRLIEPDAHERNNGWRTAAAMNEGLAVSFTQPAANDADWFRLTSDKPDLTLELTLNVPAGGSTSMRLWSGADFETEGDNANCLEDWYCSSGVTTVRYMLKEAGNYYVRVTPYSSDRIFDSDATISFRFVAPDGSERNNAYNTAVELEPRTATEITLPAGNDYDWFHIGELTSGDKVTVTWGGRAGKNPTACCTLYYLDEYETSATFSDDFIFSSATGSDSFTVQKDSDYYLRFRVYDSSNWIDEPFWIKYAVTVEDMPVTGIESITNGDRTIFETQTLQLYANVKPANATNQDVTWASSDETVATVNANGLVTGVKAGKTTVTATTKDGGFKLTTAITVAKPIRVTGVGIQAENNPSGKGDSENNPYPLTQSQPDNPDVQIVKLQLTALVEPAGATELGVVWSVSDESVLVVNEYGVVYAVGSGSAQAIATTVDGGFQAKFWINVPDKSFPVRGITLSENYRTLYLGEEGFTLKATVSPTYATNPDVVWSSSNKAVATVDQSGKVTPVAEGYADITASAAENAAIQTVCSVTVKPARIRVTGVSFAEKEMELGLYGTLQLAAVVAPADATDKSVTWTTSDKNRATVSRTGLVTALNLGEVTITATTRDGEFTASVKITVSATASLGDLNNDGGIDAGDALLVLRAAVGLIKLSDAQAAVADVNGDGEIDAGDAVLILRYDAGLIDAFPAEN